DVTVEVTNKSSTSVSAFSLSYSINGGTPIVEELTGENLIPGNGTFTYTFTQKADLSAKQVYQISVSLALAGDIDSANDALTVSVENYPELVTAITPNSTITQGESILLEATGGTEYLWNTEETTSSITVQPMESTAYSVVITDGNGCSVVRTVFVEVIPNPCLQVTCPPGFSCYEGGCFEDVYSVSGTVRNSETNEPIAGILVDSEGKFEVDDILTDSEGNFTINVTYNSLIEFSKFGYLNQTFGPVTEAISDVVILMEEGDQLCVDLACPPGTSCFQGGCFTNLVQLSGVVRDQDTQEVLSGVKISGGAADVFTDSNGTYSMEVDALTDLTFSVAGYAGKTLTVQESAGPQVLDVDLLSNCSGLTCPEGSFCFDGACFPIENDPCLNVTCPPGFSCYEGGCFEEFFSVSGTVRDSETNEPLSGVQASSVTSLGVQEVMTDENGHYTEGRWQGENIWAVNKLIAKTLVEEKKALKVEYIRHEYPHCHRCGEKLMYRAHPSWFMDIEGQREEMLAHNSKEINWFPGH
ncbi:MAG: hypothetical protein B7Z16_16300, partial [Algoriphagus sp. 32-45-6]